MNFLLFALGLVFALIAAAAIRWSRRPPDGPRKEADESQPDA